jgi:hypothetical protein
MMRGMGRSRLRCGAAAAALLLGLAGSAAAQPYYPPPGPPGYPPPGGYPPPPPPGYPPPPPPGYAVGFHCAASFLTSEGPRRSFCRTPEPRPLGERCFCDPPPPPPGFPPYQPAQGRVVR